MNASFLTRLREETEALRGAGLYKEERIIASPQQAVIAVAGGGEVLNLCANNYLGLSNHPALVAAAQAALAAIRRRGLGGPAVVL